MNTSGVVIRDFTKEGPGVRLAIGSLLIMLNRGDTKYKDICIIVALVTFLRLNPIYILRLGMGIPGLGLGYIAYIVALVMAFCCLIEKRNTQPEV